MKPTKSIVLNIILLQCSTFVFGQNNNPLFYAIEKSKSQKIDSLINFNADKNKLQYLALLPSLNYNFLESNFSVGISISNLSNYYQNKQRNKIELERLKFQLEEKKENDLFKLEKEYELILDTYDILKLELDNTTLTKEIFNLIAKLDKNKIADVLPPNQPLFSKLKDKHRYHLLMKCSKKKDPGGSAINSVLRGIRSYAEKNFPSKLQLTIDVDAVNLL